MITRSVSGMPTARAGYLMTSWNVPTKSGDSSPPGCVDTTWLPRRNAYEMCPRIARPPFVSVTVIGQLPTFGWWPLRQEADSAPTS